MTKGLGIDIIEVARIEKAILRHEKKFLDHIFTLKEQAYCQKHKISARHFSGRFAAKEAIVKALGTGINKDIGWTDIEILNDEKGKPIVNLSANVAKLFNNPTIQISISHCKEYATAVALIL